MLELVTFDPACPAGLALKDVAVPKPYLRGFRDDAVRVAQAREDGVTLEQIAAESHELREAKRRARLLEQENEVLRRAAAYLSHANLPDAEVAEAHRARDALRIRKSWTTPPRRIVTSAQHSEYLRGTPA